MTWNVLEYLSLFLIVLTHESAINWRVVRSAGKPMTLSSGRSRRGLCVTAATSRRAALEHRRRTVGECGSGSHILHADIGQFTSALV